MNNKINIARENYYNFLIQCFLNDNNFKLTLNSTKNPFALCFAIFGFNLLKKKEIIIKFKKIWSDLLISNLNNFYSIKKKTSKDLSTDKSFLQLFCFTLSALSILDEIKNFKPDYLCKIFDNNIDHNNKLVLEGSLIGKPGTGNLAMFYAIIYYFLGKNFNYNTSILLKKWLNLHQQNLNNYLVLGKENKISYFYFQNSYHQYEIFNYFDINSINYNFLAEKIISFMDSDGHYAPYIGGGACYDYDAIFLLTLASNEFIFKNSKNLNKTLNSILSNQNKDGGFFESNKIRPINHKYFYYFIKNIINNKSNSRYEILRQFITLTRPKYNKINAHWDNYKRKWNESNLWDSWFRMMTIARIDIALDKNKFNNWGFIDFPGIGYHELFKAK
tara:strand:- start:8914 stop:10077 length:1164 start_codon:yes stop_codon:yes gene_type:complete